ncbi:unnamed protein product [Rhodiola kirilowii]
MTLRTDFGQKKSFIQRIFSRKDRDENETSINCSLDCPAEAEANSEMKNLIAYSLESSIPIGTHIRPFRVFVATWNVAGKSPHNGLNLDDFLQVQNQSDIYVLGFQEIVPLNAGNVLVIEDNEPAAKWLSLINRTLNKQSAAENLNRTASSSYSNTESSRSFKSSSPTSGSLFFQKTSLRKYSKQYRTVKKHKLKSCNCTSEMVRKNSRDSCFRCQDALRNEEELSSDDDDGPFGVADVSITSNNNHNKYGLIVSKQMVGIFVTIWMKKELVQYVSHLRTSCVNRGIMGCLGNKGCISISFTFLETSFCFICSHLASGEKEGDELRRNLDVIEILKNTQFPKICKSPQSKVPDKILDHERIIWFGDLNYRIALSYSDTRKLLLENAWDALLSKDQLKIERDAGRVFNGWKEGKIYFAPTYKYSNNSDVYFGENIKSKSKRRTPAWCDRILWHGKGIHQRTYIRGENQFSDHRPVCATFSVDVEIIERDSSRRLMGYSTKVGAEEFLSSSNFL